MANKVTIGLAVILAAGMMAHNYYELMYLNDQTSQMYMRLFGSSIYEYRTLTGKWPSQIADLARTSLPLKNPDWIVQLVAGADVIVWPKNLKPEPADNGHVILAYHNKGLDAEMGRMWVCWGDLRTECITLEELQDHLNKMKN